MLFVLLCSAIALAVAHPLQSDWLAFKTLHGKSYVSHEEESARMQIWADYTTMIQMHNKANKSYTMAMNQFGDLTDEEFVTYYLNPAFSVETERSGSTFLADNVEAAATVDWRDKGYVTPIKNQGACGSCWAFSATGSLEGQHFKKTGTLVSLSEQNLVDCSKKFGNNGCKGGLMDNAFRYILSNDGIDTEMSYPYKAKTGTECHFKRQDVGATDSGHVDIPRGSESQLMSAVSTVGPISVAMDAHLTSFRFYKQGIYKDAQCSSTKLDHGVLAVGYGGDMGADYWIVKNSWGTSWGNEGFFNMARNDGNMCGIATDASYPLV
eukprot:m.305998 g.305998  ORF g.305998 m.305998 type:complete len:323 (+) comp40884_c0_seq1:62-1030(+)